jgi:putative AdoMet-dependent methyltransferase
MDDELRHAGVDYNDPAQVAAFDRRYGKLRDYRKEAEIIVRMPGLNRGHTVLDMGSGTGAFALHTAPLCRAVCAVDAAPAMLEYAGRTAAKRNLQNIFSPGRISHL